MKKCFHIQNITCASCEFVIEKMLKQHPDVLKVNVSHTSKKAKVSLKDNSTLHANELTQICKEHNYVFTDSEQETKTEPTTQSLPAWQRIGGVLIIVFALYLILQRVGFFTFSPSVDSPSGYAAIFVIGLIAAFSSCAAIVGGLLTAVSISNAERNPNASRTQKFRPHILFNVGRLAGFLVFGAVIGWIGKSVSISPTINGALIFIIGLIMIGFGINLLKILPKGLPVPKPPKSLSHFIDSLTKSEHPVVPFVLGSATFFLPCGFTQATQLYALTLGDPVSSALVMFVFALGTLPALIGIGWATSVARGRTLIRFGQVAGALILVLGIANLQNGAALLDLRLPTRTSSSAVSSFTPKMIGNKQVIEMDVTSYGKYVPDRLTVVEGVPVTWKIHGADFMGCANSLILRQFNVSTYLKPGQNTVTFTPNKTGRYTFSCSMGMIRGTMNVVPNNI